MTSSSNPGGAKPASPYARFIPREELQGFSAWTPRTFASARPDAAQPATAGASSAATGQPAQAAQDADARLQAARQSGYQDGYRDGLVALEGFKRSFAQQMSGQIGQLLRAFDGQLDQLEQQLADAVAGAGVQLARQVVRSELATRPELVARVAQDAVNAVLTSARHIRVLVHPDDQALVAEGAADVLSARGARLIASGQVSRGGVVVESDLGRTDAAIETRWAQAAALLGEDGAWSAAPAAPQADAR